MCDVIISTGEMFHDTIDLDLPGQPPLEFKRSYSSTSRGVSSLGPGWQHNWHIRLIVDERSLQILKGSDNPETFALEKCDGKQGPELRSDAAHGRIELRYPLGRRDVFVRGKETGGDWLLGERYDAYGNWTKCRYDQSRLVELTDAEHRRLQFDYNEFGLLVSILAKLSRTELRVRYRYDSQKRLVEAIDPMGAAERFDYEQHLIVRHVDKGGVARLFQYDRNARCVSNWHDVGYRFRRIEYSPDNRTIVVGNSLGWRDVYRQSPAGMLDSLTDALGRGTQWLYNDDGEQVCEILPDGTAYQTSLFDPAKRIRTITDLAGAATVFQSDEFGNTTSIKNGCGAVLKFRFNDRGRVVELTDPEGGRWQYEFDDRGRLSRLTDPKGEWIRPSYRPGEILVEDMIGIWGRYFLDDLGDLLRHEDALGRGLEFAYDACGRLIRITERDGGTTYLDMDPLGRPRAVVDAIGRKTQFAYNALESLREVRYADDSCVKYEINREGLVVHVINQKGEVTTFDRDAAQRILGVTYFDGLRQTFEYDECDRLVTVNGPDGRTKLRYEATKYPIEIDWPEGSKQSNTYDPMNRLVAIQLEPAPGSDKAPHESSFEYDGRSFITKETNDGFAVQYGLDASGYLRRIRDGLGRDVQFEVNPRGLVTRLDDAGTPYKFTYNAANELERIELPNGMHLRLKFDACSRLIRREMVSRTGAILAWRDFRYDPADQLIGMTDWRLGKYEYAYDAVGRLTLVIDGTGRLAERYQYDPAGNLVSSPLYAAWRYDPGHRLRQSDNVQYDYDASGRLARMHDGTHRWEYQYGYLSQLDAVLRDGAVVAEYGYDLCGRRRWKRTADDEVRCYYHINKLATYESDRDGRSNVVYVPDTMAPLAVQQSGRQYFFSFDQIGSPTEVWDEDEQLVAVIDAQAFGSNRLIDWRSGAPFPLPFHFQGQFRDEESGLHYNRFRYYQPTTGRFISQDPIGFAGGLNLYIYPTNPLTWIDPLGLTTPASIMLSCATKDGTVFTACEAKAAMAKLGALNKSPSYKCKKNSECRKGNQKDFYEKNCNGAATQTGFDVDHMKELQVGGGDHCCSNLSPIPARANRSLGSQIKNAVSGFAEGTILPQFSLGAPCNDPNHTKSCTDDYKPGTVKPGKTDNCNPVPPSKC